MRLDLYNNIHGDEILEAIGLKEEYIPRIRGVGIDDGKIFIHTRTGGGNRESYDDADAFINGEYGLLSSTELYKDWLKDFSAYGWQITEYTQNDFDDIQEFWKLPYEAIYRFPETDEEWAEKEVDIKSKIKGLENQKKIVEKTEAYTNKYMRNSEYFLYDEDEEFDSTYANFWFEVPEKFREKLLKTEDKIAKAYFGDSEIYIKGIIGGDKEALKQIQENVDSVVLEMVNEEFKNE